MYAFSDHSTVCFFGDSITHNGRWLRRIQSYYLQKGIRFEMYNCGIGGDTADLGYARMDETLLNHNPTDVVINFGMNDAKIHLYRVEDITDDVIRERREAIDTCLASLEKIAQRLEALNIRMIFCSPTPCDELSEVPELPYGGQAALQEIGGRVRQLAKRYGGHFVDLNGEMLRVLKHIHRQGGRVIEADRVHPDPMGDEIMAQIFLRAQGFDVEVCDRMEQLAELARRPYSAWEEKRFKLEQSSKKTDYIEWIMYRTHRDDPAYIRRDLLENKLPAETNEWVYNCMAAYLLRYDETRKLQEELIAHTKTIYTADI